MIKIIAYYILFASLVSCNLFAQVKDQKETSKRILKNNKWAFINSNNDTIQYKYIQKIDENFYLAKTNNNKSGYIDENGVIVIPIEYDFLGVFSEGLAPAEKKGKSGFIDKKGKIVVSFIYDGVGYFYKSGLSRVYKGDKVGFIDKKGNVIIPLKYDKADYNKVDNFVIVGIRQSNKSIPFGSDDEEFKWAFFSNKGTQLTDFKYNKIYESQLKDRHYTMLENGLILVEKKGKFAYLNKNFQTVIPFGKYKTAEPINNKGVAIVGNKKRYGLINKEGKLLIPINFEYIENSHFNNDLYIVSKNNKYGIYDKSGKTIVKVENSEIIRDNSSSLNSFLLYKNKNNKFGTTNQFGKPIIPFVYDTILEFDGNDISIAKKNNKYGVINFKNEIVLPFEYNNINSTDEYNDYFIVNNNEKYGLINKYGKIIIPLKYKSIEPCYYDSNNRFIVKQNNKFGVIDKEQKIIIEIKYDEISNWVEYAPKVHFITLNGKKGLISRNGKMIMEPIYELIYTMEDNIGNEFVEVKYKNKYGLFSLSNKEVLPIKYDKIYLEYWNSDEGMKPNFYVKEKNIFHLFDFKGNLINENVPYNEIKSAIKEFDIYEKKLFKRMEKWE